MTENKEIDTVSTVEITQNYAFKNIANITLGEFDIETKEVTLKFRKLSPFADECLSFSKIAQKKEIEIYQMTDEELMSPQYSKSLREFHKMIINKLIYLHGESKETEKCFKQMLDDSTACFSLYEKIWRDVISPVLEKYRGK